MGCAFLTAKPRDEHLSLVFCLKKKKKPQNQIIAVLYESAMLLTHHSGLRVTLGLV